jgi:hypothetical protein
MQAEALRPVDATKKQFLPGVRGVVVKEPDSHRGAPGLLEVRSGSLAQQPEKGSRSPGRGCFAHDVHTHRFAPH